MNTETTDTRSAFFKAQADLVGDLLGRLAKKSPDVWSSIERTLAAGGFIQIECATGLAGVIGLNLFLTSPTGERVHLMGISE